jgi:hypothetical protein
MRFLLDTNIVIPLEDSNQVLEMGLANFVRLANENGHQLVHHPASETDFLRDKDQKRLKQNLDRIKRYPRLDYRPACPWNTLETKPNDAADNEILYALNCDAVHALVTEDRGIHEKAKTHGLVERVYTIQTAEDLLRRLHERVNVELPNIEEVPLYSITPLLDTEFFASLRTGYPTFDDWFRSKAQEGNQAWVSWEEPNRIGALCIYAQQDDEVITAEGMKLPGAALKLCTFKVGEPVRGRKIGELFLKAAFRYATANRMENIFIHGDVDHHHFLFEMLQDFGFSRVGRHPGSDGRDAVYLKQHPLLPPNVEIDPFLYFKTYFPHFRSDASISKYIVPIRPEFHRILFVDYDQQLQLFTPSNFAGNAIKLAYLCHAQTKTIVPGDIVLFYRSGDAKAVTSLGVVEDYETLSDADMIAGKVRRRTVYNMEDIRAMAAKQTKVMLFRLIRHFKTPLHQSWLQQNDILKRSPQSITKISNEAFEKIMIHAK